MSLMSWLFSSAKRQKPPQSGSSGSGSRKGAARDTAGSGSGSAKRKGERAVRRELLYAVVREAMVRAGVLSSSYKFKVLSLDGEGRQFLVMIDLSRGAGGDAGNLAEIEALIAQSAKARHEILVTAVYWRVNDHVAVGRADVRRPARMADSQPVAMDSVPAPMDSAPAPLATPAARGPAYDPIGADEVEAFKKALVAGSRPAPLSPSPDVPQARKLNPRDGHGPRSYTLITGYEDTEMPEADPKAPILSGTQYGELR